MSRAGPSRGFVAIAVLAGAVLLLGAPEARTDVPRLDDVSAQLDHARACRSAMRGLEAEERARARIAAAEAYEAVVRYWPRHPASAAEAAFRAGELYRTAGRAARARDCFGRARELGARTLWRARAELELGHLRRREGEFERALDRYLALAADASAPRGLRDDAGSWVARMYAELDQADEAERWWRRVAEGAEDPLDRVRAWDRLALARVERGELEAAAGVLQTCRESLADVALEETTLGERVRDALTRMRSIELLDRAIRARRDARGETTDS